MTVLFEEIESSAMEKPEINKKISSINNFKESLLSYS
jgi:hypothetical protein